MVIGDHRVDPFILWTVVKCADAVYWNAVGYHDAHEFHPHHALGKLYRLLPGTAMLYAPSVDNDIARCTRITDDCSFMFSAGCI